MRGIYRTVLVIDYNKMIGNGIKLVIGNMFQQFLIACDGASGVSMALRYYPDLIIVDDTLPDTTGDILIRELKYKLPAVKILTYSSSYSSAVIVQMLKAGTNGYVVKRDDDDEFIKAVHAIMEGRDFFCKEAKNHVVNLFTSDLADEEDSDALINKLAANSGWTPKQILLIRLLCRQMSTRDIGHHLNLSERTVEQYRSSISRRIGAKTAAGILKYALQSGIIRLEDL